ncbi:hypothetical protein PAXINDRAFT_154046 [Paxillus involutus ATCC 200175]|nr:hypothetical protein PAXINDRAFT_154046 [Paxillus involutus ATCC 200175]
MTAVQKMYGDESWDNAGAVASALGQLPTTVNHGLVNNTVYDILMDTSGVGNATVDATTFTTKCYSAKHAYTVAANQTNIEWGSLNVTYPVMPLYEGTLWSVRPIIDISTAFTGESKVWLELNMT